MTRRFRMILSMILAVLLCVVFSTPSLAFEADEPAEAVEPVQDPVTEPAPEPTVEVSAPVEIAVIPDDDWGSVEQEVVAANTPGITEGNQENNEPEVTAAPEDTTAVSESAAAPETPEQEATDPVIAAEGVQPA